MTLVVMPCGSEALWQEDLVAKFWALPCWRKLCQANLCGMKIYVGEAPIHEGLTQNPKKSSKF